MSRRSFRAFRIYKLELGNSANVTVMDSNATGLFVTPTNYLATINNLSEAVTKTADKTMKITYTIQEQ